MRQCGAEVVREYIAAMEARDLVAARALLGDGFTMVFPGGAVFVDQMVWNDLAEANR